MNAAQRQQIERRVVRGLIRFMKKHDFSAARVDNGEERIRTPREQDVMEHAFSVDMSQIEFTHPTKTGGWVMLVMGNDGWDVISDWSYVDGSEFSTLMNQYLDALPEED
jgi:hypothetical protein